MLRTVGAGHPRFFPPHSFSMKRSALCLAILCALSHPSAWAETKELWAYGVSKDSGWYDTTKNWTNDSLMCWAATAANMLSWWQHWDTNNSASAPQGALNIYDRIKADYGQNLADTSALVGIEWWFNANTYSSGQKWKYDESGNLVVKNSDVFPKEGSFSGYYKNKVTLKDDHYYNKSLDDDGYNLPLTYLQASESLISVFKDGQTSVGLGIFSASSTGNVGHSITMWGVEYDTVSNTVSKLYVTDSDDYGRGLITLTTKEDDGKMFLLGDGYYSSGSWYVDNFVTFDLNSPNASAGADSASGYNSNFYALENGVITNVSSGSAPSVDASGNVTYSGDATYSSSTSGLNLHAGSTTSYKEINNVNFKSWKISLSNVILEAQGEVKANYASLVVKNATLIGNKISLGSGTEVKMTNAWIETTGTEKGEAKTATFQGTGTIKNMTITEGSLISGNSPGLMELSGDQLATVELSFYLGAGTNQEMSEAGRTSKIVLDTTLASGVLEGTEAKVSSGFLLTQGTTLSGDITLSVWNEGSSFNMNDDKTTPRYFSEGSYIQVIAFGEGVSYRDVLGVNFILGESIVGRPGYDESIDYDRSLMAVSDSTGNAYWQKQVRTDGVYLVLSSAAVYDVPEPATGVLVLTGLGLLLRRRRRS